MSEHGDEFAPRIDAIETQWSIVRRAHQGSKMSVSSARNLLVMRYTPSIRSYVRALTANDDHADELAQDVVVRILKGDFAGADSDRGRFRDLLKIAVRNMVRTFWDKQNRRRTVDLEVEETLEIGHTPPESDPWLAGWRNNILENAWLRLEEYQIDRPNSVAFSILKLRTDNPDEDTSKLAARLTEVSGREYRAENTRQQLRRARVRFAEFLVAEIADGLDRADPDRIKEELICLGLYEQIRDILPENWA